MQFLATLCLVVAGYVEPQDEPIQAFLARHCLECHSGEKPKGELRLDKLSVDFDDSAIHEQWASVLKRIESGEMPPETQPRPPEDATHEVTAWIRKQVQTAEAVRRAREGRVVLRRLNRTEYENTISDLLGIKVNLKAQLPEDGSADGFDNAGAALHTSAFLLEKYLEAAETALNQAIVNSPNPPPLISKRIEAKESRQIKVTTESVYRHLDDAVVCFSSSAWQMIDMTGFYPPDGGLYRFRIRASGYQSQGKPVTYRVTAGRTRLSGKDGLVGYFDAPADEPTIAEFIQHMEPRTTINLLPYGLASSQAVNKIGADAYEGPGLALEWMEVEGPLYDDWPPDSHRRIFGELEQKPSPAYNQSKRVEVVSLQPLADVGQILRTFVRRAFRREVTDEDIAPFVGVAEARMTQGLSFEQAVRAALKGVLLSPEFLFLRELPGELDDYALASRLSYFLWSTMPDETLFTLAGQRKLHEPDVLREQVERMLNDPRSRAFTENFVGQWLGLREIDFTEPSHLLYPEYDHMLKVSMIREAELFFEEVLKENLSLTHFVASDFSMLNGRLARHYGIPGVDGWEFRKVALPPESHRGGVLTMAGVLKVTANGTTTSPVMRGAWVLDRILGAPAPPPPDDVGAIDPDIRGATTIRDQLAKHRSLAACASCHTQIDPPGFALESFDCIGGWRDKYRITGNGESVTINGQRMLYRLGKPVDPSDVMPDGHPFENVDQFKQILLEEQEQIAAALTSKLVAYATGKAPAVTDRPAVEAIVARIGQSDYGFRSLIHEIVQSDLFRRK